MIKKRIVLYISFLLLPISIIAQNAGYVKLTGQVKLRGSNNELNDVSMTFYSGGEKVNEIKANSIENFQTRLDLNKKYLIEVNKTGLVKLKYEFDTHLPEGEVNKIHPFYLRVYLFANFPELDLSIYGSINSTIKFDETTGKFAFSRDGNENLQQRLVENDNQILGLTKQKLQVYESSRNEGDRAYDERLFQAALNEYKKAEGLFPREASSFYVDTKYIEDRIRICEKMVAEAGLNQDEYNKTIAVAEKLFDSKEYERAKVSYQKALSLRPGASKPSERLQEIAKITADNKVHNVLYDVALESAMKWLELKDYEKALGDFEQASLIKPDEEFPKSKVNELKKILEEITAKRETYDKLIAQADNKFDIKDYTPSREDYVQALNLFPDEKYPQNRINDIDIILKEIDNQSEQKKKYDGLIAGADELFIEKKYEDARNKYREASKLRPAEEYPKKKINEINEIIARSVAQQRSYDEAIKNADAFFDADDYDNAKEQYNRALTYKPDEAYPKQKISEIDNIIAEQVLKLANDKKYDEAIQNGDSKYELKEYADALTHYREASGIKPAEEYPKEKISEIGKILAERKSVQESYDRTLTNADRLFDEKEYQRSRSAYEEALKIKEENYPKEKITEIDKILTDLSLKQQAYDKAIAEADQLFGSGKYIKAKQFYSEARDIKPDEDYPSEKINEIDKILADAAAKDEAYANAIASGDSHFNAKEYEKARESYLQASEIKTEEKYPKDKLNEIAGILSDIRAMNENYAKAITSGDEKFEAKVYDESRKFFEEAHQLKPNETYPNEKIREIDKILADIEANEKAYNEAIALGDKSFKTKDYLIAKDQYLKAADLKPDRTYSKEKLREIEQILAEARSLQESYDNAITRADKLFNEKDYVNARPEYEAALTFKPKESYPNEKIAEIDNILADIKAKQDAYDKAIAMGDEKFGSNDLTGARQSYEDALGIKPNETYPGEKISEIDKMLADAKAKQQAYDQAIASGDSQFSNKEYEKAKASFGKASEIRPEESYPKEKIKEIENILAELMTKEEAYKKAIGEADQKFSAKDYENSKLSYLEAQKVKPAEKYPGERIAEIDKILAAVKAQREKYNDLITKADAYYADKKYNESLGEYKNASDVLPHEEYPKTRIKEIETLLADIRAKEEAYKNAIASADQKYSLKQYPEAKAGFQKALDAKPWEKYPAEKISEINDILAEIKRINDAFDNAVGAGASYFKAKEYENALEKYKKADEIKPGEQFVKERMIEINNILLADQKARQEAYDKAIAAADRYYNTQDYKNALKDYENASNIKTDEEYPKRKISEINSILEEQRRLLQEKYDKVIAEADRLYETRILDQAIDKYKQAILILPDEKYPRQKIDEITRFIIDNAIVDVNKEAMLITEKSEKKFSFEPVDIRARKSAYVFLKIKNLSNKPFKLFLNYGMDATKSGGVTFDLEAEEGAFDYIIRVSVQDKWYRVDNNWLSVYPQGGDIEISSIRISKGE